MHNGGKTIHLQAGNFRAKIVTVGAGLAELTHRGRHIVIPHEPEEMPLAHLGKVLVPGQTALQMAAINITARPSNLPLTTMFHIPPSMDCWHGGTGRLINCRTRKCR